jgi:hypothetical protein
VPQDYAESSQQNTRHAIMHHDYADDISYQPLESIEKAGRYTPDWAYYVPDVSSPDVALTYLGEILAYAPASNDRREWNGAE